MARYKQPRTRPSDPVFSGPKKHEYASKFVGYRILWVRRGIQYAPRLSFEVSPELRRQVLAAAKKNNRKVSVELREVLTWYYNDLWRV